MITITIQAASLDEAIVEFSKYLVPSARDSQTVAEVAAAVGKAVDDAEKAAPVVKTEPLVEKAAADVPPPAAPVAVPKTDDVRTKIRAVLAPLMSNEKRADAVALIGEYGGRISSCPDDKVQELLERAEALAS